MQHTTCHALYTTYLVIADTMLGQRGMYVAVGCRDAYLIDGKEDSIAWGLPDYGSFQPSGKAKGTLCFE